MQKKRKDARKKCYDEDDEEKGDKKNEKEVNERREKKQYRKKSFHHATKVNRKISKKLKTEITSPEIPRMCTVWGRKRDKKPETSMSIRVSRARGRNTGKEGGRGRQREAEGGK